MFKLAHHINGSAWLNLSHHIFSNHLFFPSFFWDIESAFYTSSIFASYYNTHIEWKLNFFKKQTIGHKRSIEYQVKEQDTLLTYKRGLSVDLHLAKDKILDHILIMEKFFNVCMHQIHLIFFAFLLKCLKIRHQMNLLVLLFCPLNIWKSYLQKK